MKAFTLYQPYASLIACGAKRFETRGWYTHYRGKIAIHAGLKKLSANYYIENYGFQELVIFQKSVNSALNFEPRTDDRDVDNPVLPEAMTYNYGISDLPYGAIIATADLTNCYDIGETNKINGFLRKEYTDKGLMPYDEKNVYCEVKTSNKKGGLLFITENELLFGDWTEGRYAWELQNIEVFAEPIPAKGRQGLWNWEESA